MEKSLKQAAPLHYARGEKFSRPGSQVSLQFGAANMPHLLPCNLNRSVIMNGRYHLRVVRMFLTAQKSVSN